MYLWPIFLKQKNVMLLFGIENKLIKPHMITMIQIAFVDVFTRYPNKVESKILDSAID